MPGLAPAREEDFEEYPARLALAEFQPLETERLRLRLLHPSDAPTIQRLAGEYEVAKTLSYLPHPYEDGIAELFIDSALAEWSRGEALHLAITMKSPGGDGLDGDPPADGLDGDAPADGLAPLIGIIALEFNHLARLAELGYWLGVPYWNKGYATEAARAVVEYGFKVLRLNRIQARHMTNNPASGRVLQKLGMAYEGTHRQATRRFGAYQDLAVYAILRSEYLAKD
ncbi:MAG: GNAT family protein [Limnochordales bacterium]